MPCLQIILTATLPHPLSTNHIPLLFYYTHKHIQTYNICCLLFHFIISVFHFLSLLLLLLYILLYVLFLSLYKSSFPFLCFVFTFFLLFSWLLWRGPWENFDRDWKSLIVLLLPYIVSVFMIFLYFVCYYRACLFIQFIHSFVEMQHAAL